MNAFATTALAKGAILALDFGTTTGWVLSTTDPLVVSGTASFRPGQFEGGEARFLRFRARLHELMSGGSSPYSARFEEMRPHVEVDAAQVYGGLLVADAVEAAGEAV